eukprot:2652445-Rhodomonas_salina.2
MGCAHLELEPAALQAVDLFRLDRHTPYQQWTFCGYTALSRTSHGRGSAMTSRGRDITQAIAEHLTEQRQIKAIRTGHRHTAKTGETT